MAFRQASVGFHLCEDLIEYRAIDWQLLAQLIERDAYACRRIAVELPDNLCHAPTQFRCRITMDEQARAAPCRTSPSCVKRPRISRTCAGRVFGAHRQIRFGCRMGRCLVDRVLDEGPAMLRDDVAPLPHVVDQAGDCPLELAIDALDDHAATNGPDG